MRSGVRRIAIVRDGRTMVDAGSPDATASAARELIAPNGRPVGQLRVSNITAAELARLIRRVTALDAAVRAAGPSWPRPCPASGATTSRAWGR